MLKKIEKKEVIKHSAAIQITNYINLLQRRAWNILLAYAYDDLLNKETHQISVSKLIEILNYDSNDDKHLKESLEALARCAIVWNVLGKDKKEWGVSALLASAVINNGTCTYSFSPPLRQNLHNPSMYARISLSLQNQFNSNHSLALYELFIDYFKVGETPLIPLEKFKQLMGLVDTEYPNFRDLNRRVIKEPINEINEKTDLQVNAKYLKDRKKVVALKFYIEAKPGSDLAITTEKLKRKPLIPQSSEQQSELLEIPVPTSPQTSIYRNALTEKLTSLGIVKNRAQKLVQEYDSEVIERQIEYFRYIKENEPHRVSKNPAGFLIDSIKHNYPEPHDLQSRKKKEEEEKEIEKMKQYYKQREEEKDRQLEEKRRQFQSFFEQLPKKEQDMLMEKALAKVRGTFPHIYKRYLEYQNKGISLKDMLLPIQANIISCRDYFIEELYGKDSLKTNNNHKEKKGKKIEKSSKTRLNHIGNAFKM